jgi:HEAT repeat protein
MQPRIKAILVAAPVLLAACFQAEAPPPAAAPRPGIAASQSSEPLQRVLKLVDHPEEQALPKLAAIARHDANPAVREEALYAIADIGSEADAATIAEALRDPDEGVRISAIDILSTMDGETPAALLVSALQDANARVRLKAVEALGDIDGPTATLALQQALADPDARIRETAAELLEERNFGRL